MTKTTEPQIKKNRAKTERINFTQDSLEARIKEAKKTKQRRTVYDESTKSLGLLIQPTGHASFFWFVKVGGRPTWKTIGKYPNVNIYQARQKAAQFDGELGAWQLNDYKGPAPIKGNEKRSHTLGSILEEYITHHLSQEAKNPVRAVKLARWQFDRYLSDLKDRNLNHIREDELRDLHQRIGSKHGKTGPKDAKAKEGELKHGRHTANRVLDMVRTLYNWAIRNKKWSGTNPAGSGIERYPEKKRKRYVGQSADEMPRFFKAVLAEKNIDARDAVLLALFTGARKSDVLGMRWDQLNLQTGLWTIEDPKNNEPYTVTLGSEAVVVLRSRLANRAEGEKWVFSSHGKSGHLRDVRRCWLSIRKEAKLTDVRFHDLRRTLGSWQAASGASLQIIGKSLGHKSQQSTEVYAHLQLAPVRASVQNATAAMLQAAGVTSLLEAHNEETK